MVARSRHINFTNCTFTQNGAWGLRLHNGTQHAAVSRCSFADLSGGAVAIGDVNDTRQTNPQNQTASITIADNVIEGMGREYKGAPGVHSFCMRDSAIEHNTIRSISYTGISYNWPAPQGSTLGGVPCTLDPQYGYSRNNRVANNDVSAFMSYMYDGGGIHTIGRSLNTTITGNYFHDIAAGTPSAHSSSGQSVVYIDNWSCGLAITDTVVSNCAATKQGFYYFQNARIALAHDNTLDRLYVRHGGRISGNGVPCNCSNVVLLNGSDPWPQAAKSIIANAGPREVSYEAHSDPNTNAR